MSTEDDARRIALALPEVHERTSYGTPAWAVGRTVFARLLERPGELLCWCADLAEREALLHRDPEAFTTTPHYDGHASVIVRLEQVSAEELEQVLHEAWRARAPKRLLGAS
ncbi:MmcQ/YjbR family DNA-binding protein [Rathayibacter sp. Leaf248]|uniref:MmcQ/YjbR family DNA-binding protein n=1 Tax=Rathayibacter sp. Leaf248 TaxID=2876555 RepID=UPI001E3A260E|nr:MmcQ/YjbR family DNA-binding protein [Rathayibacter sp. Leaf248]